MTALAGSAEPRFNRDVRPLLSDRCFSCHGPDQSSRKAKLRLDVRDIALERGAIVPGKPEESSLVKRIFATDPDEVMPPADSHLTLSPAEKKVLRDWIAQGAAYEPHWAFMAPPAAIPLPEVKKKSWPRNEIDYFVLARLEKEKLKPSKESSRERWLRRVTFDLTGLPPTIEEVDGFLADKSPTAYDVAVDRLLRSQRFGERMAVPWLDAVRYADSYGYQSDQLSPTWPYRDWVVRTFNRNLPYDQFLIEQLAGDLLPGATREQRLATAFNRLHRQTNEGGSVEEEWRLEYVADRVQTAGSVVMGLTFECARCHDHKFDPITQRDFYSMSAFFNSIDEWGTYNGTAHVPTPSLLLPTAEQEALMTETATQLEAARRAWAEKVSGANSTFQQWKERGAPRPESGLVAHFTFDDLETNQFVNLASRTNKAALGANSTAPGKIGQAIRFTGDDGLVVSRVLPSVRAHDQYSAVFWLNVPADFKEGLIFHATEGTDAGYHGTEFLITGGKLFFVIKRFWPGNAIAIETTAALEKGVWTHVGVAYDGSGDAGGMRIFVNGTQAQTRVVRNSLTKDPQNGDSNITFGARSRTSGLKGVLMDDLRIFNRPVAELEVSELFGKTAPDESVMRDLFVTSVSPEIREARQNRSQALKKYFEARNSVQEASVMEDLKTAREAFLLERGRYDAPKTDKTKVTRSTPAFLPKFDGDAPKNRLGLARWLTAANHPLTARVAVNRFWQTIFGRGLVNTVDNFGLQGTLPSHPELLDWLARDFINSGWDTKALVKKMVLSATYRQDSVLRPDLREMDPENVLLARGPAHRLSAEMIRDTALAVSGLIDEKPGGPPVSPYMPGDLWRESNAMSPAYRESVGTDLYRRSVYTVIKRTAPMPNMTAFDAPSREACVLKRPVTGTPQQAFVLLNDTQFVEAARALAEKMIGGGAGDAAEKIRFAFRRVTGRQPDRSELKLLGELWTEQKRIFHDEPERAGKLVAVGAKKADPSIDPVELAAMTQVVQAIFNLDASIWKR